MWNPVGKTRTVRSIFLCGVLVAPVYGPCNREPRADNHLTRVPKLRVLPTELPTAVTPQTKHAFGTWDAGSEGSHEFVVRNDGKAPLTLSGDPSPDPAIRCEILRNCIPPGETGAVRVTWSTGREGPAFSREVLVHTDDPFCRKLIFTVEGTVRFVFAADPPVLSLGEVHPSRSSVAETIIFSQVWNDFTVEEVSCSLPGATWTVESAAVEVLQTCEAKCGYRLTVTAPADMPRGPIQGGLNVRVAPVAEPGSAPAGWETLELPIAGRVLRRFALYGDGVESNGAVDLGHLRLGQGLKQQLLMKIRDSEPDVRIAAIHTKPDFLKVSIEPIRSDNPTTGLYHFNIEVSPDAPPCDYLGLRYGEIHVEVDHPRVENLQLKVFFSVRPER